MKYKAETMEKKCLKHENWFINVQPDRFKKKKERESKREKRYRSPLAG